MFALVAAGLLAASPEGQVAEQAMARCDRPAYQAAVARIEGQALIEMKAATAAVAKAARAGDVGSAGDAEWARYQALMAEAERLRWAAAGLATCRPGASAESVAEADPVRPLPAAPPAPAPGTADNHFRLGIDLGGADFQIQSPTRFRIIEAGGPLRSFSSTPSAPTFPGATVYGNLTDTNRFSAPLKTDAWSNRVGFSWGFAPGGLDHAGWRFGGDVEGEVQHVKQYLPAPLIGTVQTTGAVSSVCYNFTNPCTQYQNTQPAIVDGYSRTFFSILRDDIDQKAQLLGGRVSVSHQWFTTSPVGVISIEPGLRFGSGWQSIREYQTTVGDSIFQPETAYNTITYFRRATGPFASAEFTLAAGGRVLRSWPLRWSVTGSAGFKYYDLDLVTSPSGTGSYPPLNITSRETLERTRYIASYGFGLSYTVLRNWNVRLDALHRQDSYLSSFVLTPSMGAAGVSDGVTSFNLRTAQSWLYTLGLDIEF